MLFPASSFVTFSCHSSFLPRFQSQNIIAIVVIFWTWTGRSVLLVTWRCSSTEAFSILVVDNVTICVKNCFSGKFNAMVMNFIDNVYDWRHLLLVTVVYLFCGNLFLIISSFFLILPPAERDARLLIFVYCRWFCFWLWTTYTSRTRSIMNFMNNETEAVAEVLVHEKRVIIKILTEKVMRDVLRSTVYSCRATYEIVISNSWMMFKKLDFLWRCDLSPKWLSQHYIMLITLEYCSIKRNLMKIASRNVVQSQYQIIHTHYLR